jgi:hypothetical protein
MAFDHRFMMADALSRIRGKIKYLPVVLEALLPDAFTMGDLYRLVSAITGRPLDRPNFWRLFSPRRRGALLIAAPRARRTVPLSSKGRRDSQTYRFAPGTEGVRLESSIAYPFVHAPGDNG